MKIISKGYIALLTLIILSQACIKENLADCNFNIAVEFNEQNNCGRGPLYAEVKNVTVFAFNESGVYVDQFSDNHSIFDAGYKLPLSLPQGKYTLVAWAGFNTTQFNIQSLVKGQTTLAELYMPSYSIKSGIKEVATQPMFSGAVSHINIIDGVSPVISLTATAKPLTINLSGIAVNHNYQLRISNNAVQYKFENALLSLLTEDHYTLASFIAINETGNYQVQTSLLWPTAKYNPQLIIRDLTTGLDIYHVDVKALLAQLQNSDLDCEPAINMDITPDQSDPTKVAIVVNGWTLQYITNEI